MRASRSCDWVVAGALLVGCHEGATSAPSSSVSATPPALTDAAAPIKSQTTSAPAGPSAIPAAATVAAAVPTLPREFVAFRPKERLFELAMPPAPSETVRSANAPSGDVVTTHVVTGVFGASGFTIIWQDNTAGTGASGDLFERIKAQKAQSNVILRERRVKSAAGLDALELEMTTKASKHVVLQVFAAGSVIYNLLAIDTTKAQAQAFFDSFKLL